MKVKRIVCIVPGSAEPQSSDIWEGGRQPWAGLVARIIFGETSNPNVVSRSIRIGRNVFETLSPANQDLYLGNSIMADMHDERTPCYRLQMLHADQRNALIDRYTLTEEEVINRLKLAFDLVKQARESQAVS